MTFPSQRFYYVFICVFFLLIGSFFYAFKKQTPLDYWIWAGIRPEKHMAHSVLYLYQGEISITKGRVTYERAGLYPHPRAKAIFLVYRIVGELPSPHVIARLFESSANLWHRHHVNVVGMQLDFDSPTSKLLQYNNFLYKIRHYLPSTYKVSITGLGDWVISGDQKILREMSKYTDEIIFQLYQGRTLYSNVYIDSRQALLQELMHRYLRRGQFKEMASLYEKASEEEREFFMDIKPYIVKLAASPHHNESLLALGKFFCVNERYYNDSPLPAEGLTKRCRACQAAQFNQKAMTFIMRVPEKEMVPPFLYFFKIVEDHKKSRKKSMIEAEALHYLVADCFRGSYTRDKCQWGLDFENKSREWFMLLHKKYKETEWAKKTPYYY